MRFVLNVSAALLCAAAPTGLLGQTPATASIEGRVVDAITGAPLAGVVVHVEDPRRHEVTHEDGEFHLTRLPPGRYTLLFERFGYATRALEVTLGLAEVKSIDVRMTAAAVELEGLVVTATMGGRSSDDALRPTTVVAGRDLQRQLDATVAATLDAEAGVAVASMGPAPARPVIRGLGGDRVLILEDGERVGDVSSSSPDHAVAVDPVGAERIEVVRGPAALFYGSNALGGVVNVIVEEIPTTLPHRLHGAATLQGRSASEGYAVQASAVGPVIDRLAARGELSWREAGDMETPLGAVENSSIRTGGGSFGTAWVDRWGHVGVAARGFVSRYGIPPDTVSGHEHGVTVEMERMAVRGQVHWTHPAGPFDHLELDAKATQLDHLELEHGGVVGTEIGLNTYALELVGRHSGSGVFDRGAVGARVQRADHGADRGHGAVLSVDEWDAAVYALEELDVARLQLQVGGRIDWSRRTPVHGPESIGGVAAKERDFANASGSLSALYRLTERSRLGIAVTRAFRTPSTDELYSDGPHLASYTFEVGNPELKAETGHGVDVFLRLDRRALRGELAVFWNRISDYVQPRNTGNVDSRSGLFMYRATNTAAEFRGAEAALEWSPLSHVVLDGTVSFVRGQDLDADEPLPLVPPLQGDVALRYERTAWFVETGWRGASDQERVPARPALPMTEVGYCDETAGTDGCRPVPGEFLSTEGHGVWSFAGGFRWSVGDALNSITVAVENAGDTTYRNHLSRIKELLPEQGRSINIVYRVGF